MPWLFLKYNNYKTFDRYLTKESIRTEVAKAAYRKIKKRFWRTPPITVYSEVEKWVKKLKKWQEDSGSNQPIIA